MEWFRHRHGLASDAKLGFVASRCGVHRAFVVMLWCHLLERSNACDDRGSISRFDREEASFSLDMDRETIDRIIAEMTDRGMIVDDRIAKWNVHQYQSDSSYERVKRYRDKHRNGHETLQDVTRNVSVTDRSRSDTDTDTEKETPIGVKKARASRRVPAIDQLTIDDEIRAIAESEGRNAERELVKFTDSCRAKGKAHKDYRAAFRNWLRSPYGKPAVTAGTKQHPFGFGDL